MRFLTDQDVCARTVALPRGWGHDVATAAELGKPRPSDTELLRAAETEKRILVTRDRDFGNLVVVQGLGSGVLHLRMLPSAQAVVHAELERVLARYSETELLSTFVVVERGRHRLRRVPQSG
jgi:predicted nuclease of predicted toxin-antitoxin system